jgi:acid phosphatase family membrane protein YuiD
MPAVTFIVVAAVVGLLLGAALVPGAPIFAIPIVAILIVILGATEFRRRSAEAQRMQGFRAEADSDPIEFTERDKRTLVD